MVTPLHPYVLYTASAAVRTPILRRYIPWDFKHP
jgi:hypothetical protein